MTDPQQTPIPQPGEIKTIVVVDLNGRTHTYVELLEALAAVYRLDEIAAETIQLTLENASRAGQTEGRK